MVFVVIHCCFLSRRYRNINVIQQKPREGELGKEFRCSNGNATRCPVLLNFFFCFCGGGRVGDGRGVVEVVGGGGGGGG